MASALQVRLLGELEVVRDGRPVPLPASKKTRALLGYLAATGQPVLRERLCELLWEGPDDPRASLRWSLAKLRPLVDDERSTRLLADRDRIGFEAHGAEIDLHSVRAAVGKDLASASVQSLRQGAERFRGELLDGIDLPGCYRFHAWCAAEREAARTLRIAILASLSERTRDDPEQALGYARMRLAVDPLAEAAHVALARRLADLGRTREALRQIEACRQLLSSELGSRPSAELERVRVELAARARDARESEPTISAAAPSPAAPAPSTSPSTPLVGRAAECAALDEIVAGRRELLLISGDAGIGKSRLLDELARKVAARSGRVLRGRAFEAEMVRPYGALIDALRAIPPSEIDAALHADLAPLLPELGAVAEAGDRNRLFDAVARLLSAQARVRPLALILDDLHWLDEASVGLLHYLARADLGEVVLASATRRGELEDNRAALKLVRALQRDRRLRAIALGPLDAAETAQLTRSIGASLDATRVFAESAGNPLFALEVARALSGGGDPAETLDGLLAERLDDLDPQVRDLVPWAAAIGRSFPLDLLQRATGLPAAGIVAAVGDLERAGILRAADSGYDFVHDLVRGAAYRKLSTPRRRLMHLQIARALSATPDPDGALAGDVAHHAALGDDLERAARACIAAGARCHRLFAARDAEEMATRGLALVAALPLAVRLPLEMELLAVRVQSGFGPRSHELEVSVSRTLLQAEAAGLCDTALRGFFLLSLLHYRDDNVASAHDNTLRSVEAARSADPPTAARVLATTSRCLVLIDRDLPRATALADEARGIGEALRLEVAEVPWAVGLIRHHEGDLDGAVAAFRTAVAWAERTSDSWQICMCLTSLACIELERGAPRAAIGWCEQVAALVEKLGEGSEGPFAEALAAVARRALDEPGADRALESALTRLREVDSKSLLGYALDAVAALELKDGRLDAARRHAEEALEAARALDRRSEMTVARMLLARIALSAGAREPARSQLEAVLPDLATRYRLSDRARRAVDEVARQLGIQLPTPAPTEASTPRT